MTPGGIEGTDLAITVTSRFDAFVNYAWNPLNIHRLLANVCFGGASRGRLRRLPLSIRHRATTSGQRFDWMGYVGSFIAVAAFIPLPFAGYYLGPRDLRLQPADGRVDDGRILRPAVDSASHPDRFAVSGDQPLPVAGHGPHPGRRALSQVPGAGDVRAGDGSRGMGHAPHHHRDLRRDEGPWAAPHHPKLGVPGRHVGQEHRRQPDDSSPRSSTFMLYRRGNKQATSSFAVLRARGSRALALRWQSDRRESSRSAIYGYFVPAAVRVGLSEATNR